MQTHTQAGHTLARDAFACASPYEQIVSHIENLTWEGVIDPDGVGPGTIRRWLALHDVDEIIDGITRSFAITVKAHADQDTLHRSVRQAFHKVPAMIQQIKDEETKPYIGKLLYVQGIIRNKLQVRQHRCFEYLEDLHVNHGYALSDLEQTAKGMHVWEPRYQTIENWYAEFEGRL
jgi:hypothetical protein